MTVESAIAWVTSLAWDRIIEVASIAVAATAAVAAFWTGRVATEAARAEAKTAEKALAATPRQLALSALPLLDVDDPTPLGSDVDVRVRNAGQVVAYGVLIRVLPTSERGPDAVPVGPGKAWGRVSALAPGADPIRRYVKVADLSDERPAWVQVVIEFYSPIGAAVRHTYEAGTDDSDRRWRLRRVLIDPKDGGPLITFDPDLGSDDDPDRTPVFIAWA